MSRADVRPELQAGRQSSTWIDPAVQVAATIASGGWGRQVPANARCPLCVGSVGNRRAASAADGHRRSGLALLEVIRAMSRRRPVGETAGRQPDQSGGEYQRQGSMKSHYRGHPVTIEGERCPPGVVRSHRGWVR